jgi:hypothetical protein
MKKMLGVLMVAMVCMAMAIPASAVENEFGGYWRTRGLSMTDFDGLDSGTRSYVDTRTRIYYTAKFSDKFKFVNKFEIDNSWGDTAGGDIGADAVNIEVKNTYADFFVGDHNFKVGVQPGKIARGFLFDDDFSGLTATFKLGSVSLPFMWMKANDNDITTPTYAISASAGSSDRDYFAVSPVFNLNDSVSINPYFLYDKEQGTETALFYLGADINAKMDNVTAWGTAILETGEQGDDDTTAFLVGAGADAGLVHGQIFYASGDDDGADDERDDFGLWKGQTYYWSEIMGEGIFDGPQSNNAPGVGVTNVMAANIGVAVKPMDKLTLTGDVWYAQLAEEKLVNGSMEDVLGVEIDLKATYMVLDNLKLDVVAAYLIAGDATGEEDPIEIGTQLSFSF